jgi:stress-induced morphogen
MSKDVLSGHCLLLVILSSQTTRSLSLLCHLLPSIDLLMVWLIYCTTRISYTTLLLYHTMNRLLPTISSSSRSAQSTITRPVARQLLRTPISLSATRLYSTRPTPEGLDEGEKAIYDKLSATFPGNRLEVQDVSGKLHRLYVTRSSWYKGGCGSFYAIEISSSAFKGLSTIKQHKLVNSCLKEDIKTIHGLQVSLRARIMERVLCAADGSSSRQ